MEIPVDKEKIRNGLISLAKLRAESKGTTPLQEMDLLKAELLERRLKMAGLLKDETLEEDKLAED